VLTLNSVWYIITSTTTQRDNEMRTSTAKKLIETELTKLMGYEMSFNSEFNFLALGVKLEIVTSTQAAKRIVESVKFYTELAFKSQ